MTSLPRKDALVLDHRYYLGDFSDYSGENNFGVPTGCNFIKRPDKHLRFNGTDVVTVADSPELQLTQGTLMPYGDINAWTGGDRFISKRDAGGTNYDLYWGNTAQIYLYDGAAVGAFNVARDENLKSLAITFETGTVKAKAYRNGAFLSEANNATTITPDDAPLHIGNLIGGNPCSSPLKGALIWNTPLTAAEVAQAHAWIMEQRTPSYPKKHFVFPSQITGRESGTLFAATCKSTHGKIVDKVGGTQGTIVKCSEDRLIANIPAMRFVNASSVVTFGNIANLGTADFSMRCLLKINTAMTEGRMIVIKNQNATNKYYWFIEPTLRQMYFFGQTTTGISINSADTTTLAIGKVYHLLITGDRDGSLTYFINGASSSADAFSDVNSLDNTGNFYLGFPGVLDQDISIAEVQLWNKAFSQEEVSADYQKYASKPVFLDDLKDANVSVAAEGGTIGTPLSSYRNISIF